MTDSASTHSGRSSWFERLSFSASGKELDSIRSLKLVLDVPVLRTSGKSRDYRETLKTVTRSWNGLANHPIELLRKIEHFLNKLNAEKIPSTQRAALVEHSLQYACPAIRKIYSGQYKAESLPETHERREGLIVAVNVCSQLATGYKQQLLLDFDLPKKPYLRVHDRVRAYTLRVLELIRIEQRLRAMRYQKLSRKTWVDCNRLYFAVSQCEDVSEQSPGLTCLQPELGHSSSGIIRMTPPTISIQQAYLAIHLFGLIDINSMSAQKMHIADLQLSRALDQLEISADDGQNLQEGQAIVYYGQDGPAFFNRRDDKAMPVPRYEPEAKSFWKKPLADEVDQTSTSPVDILAKKIDLAPLTRELSQEYRKLIAHFADHKPAGGEVSDTVDLARLLVVDTMHDRLRLKQREQEREYVGGQEVLHVYSGFMPAYNLLNDAREGVAGSGQGLRDILARQSALISPDPEMHQFGQWFVHDKNAGGVHIKTRESQFTHAMFIGQILAFSYSREELASPLLGYVARLNRTVANEIEVTIRILSTQALATLVQNVFLSQNDMAMPAILMEDKGEKRLVLHHSHRLVVNAPVQLDVNGELCKYTLASLSQLQREFIVYSLTDGHRTH